MSLLDKIIRSAARPKSFWAMFAVCFSAPIIALPYVLLVNYGVIRHTMLGFLFFVAWILLAACFLFQYLSGLLAGKYRDLKGLSWSELPW
jgi:hypothetical protein